jgi:hypothetical protein
MNVPILSPAQVTQNHTKQLLARTALLLILILAALLRFSNLATNPGWYSDEGSDLDIARHLMEGHFQYFAISGTPLVAARMPLFHLALVGGIAFWGYDVLTARLLVAIVGFATIVLLYFAVRQMIGEGLALLAAFVYTIIPNVLLYGRIAFVYNVQALFLVLCWWALWEFASAKQPHWLGIASFASACAYMTALTGLPLVICVGLVALWYKPRHLLWCVPLMLAPGLLYLGILLTIAPTAFQQDLALTLGRTNDSLLLQLFNLVSNYTLWFDWTAWIVLGIAGIFLIEESRARNITLLVFFSTLFNVMRFFPGSGDSSSHRYLEVLPLIGVGAAQFILSARHYLSKRLNEDLAVLVSRIPRFKFDLCRRGIIGAMIFGALFAPLLWTSAWDYYLIASPESPRPTRLDPLLVTKPGDAIKVTDFVNTHTRSGDVVLASPTIAWRIRGNVADFQQALAFEGITTENYAEGLPRDRFVFDPSFQNATFIIVDNLWRGWAAERMPPLKNYLRQIESWQRVMQQGEFDVYRNPKR